MVGARKGYYLRTPQRVIQLWVLVRRLRQHPSVHEETSARGRMSTAVLPGAELRRGPIFRSREERSSSKIILRASLCVPS